MAVENRAKAMLVLSDSPRNLSSRQKGTMSIEIEEHIKSSKNMPWTKVRLDSQTAVSEKYF